jgi:hypothetical protein
MCLTVSKQLTENQCLCTESLKSETIIVDPTDFDIVKIISVEQTETHQMCMFILKTIDYMYVCKYTNSSLGKEVRVLGRVV